MTSSGSFAHLHNHTEFSALDGLQRMDQMCAAAVTDGQRSVACTDHGTNGGWPSLAKAADQHGLKAIAGQEIYLAVGSRHEQETSSTNQSFEGSKVRRYYHLTVLAKDAVGLRNLIAGSNKAAQTVWFKPRWDFDLLREHGDGLILGTGCVGGPVAAALIDNPGEQGFKTALGVVEQLLEAVNGDKDRLFVEVMDHGIAIEAQVVEPLVRIAQHFGLRIVATNDAHYTHEDEAVTHDRFLAVGVNKPVDDPDRFRFDGHGYHLRTAEQMRRVFTDRSLFGGQDPVSNSLAICEQVTDTLSALLPAHRMRLPKLTPPDDVVASFVPGAHGCVDVQQWWLYTLVRDGAVKRYGHLTVAHKERLRYELDVINGFGFAGYFLIVWELVSWVRSQGRLVGPGRGSAAGSMVSYALGITGMDPLEHNLLFERFLDPTRAGMPDIDLDFEQAFLGQVVGHLEDRYGADHVAQIGTNGSKKAKKVLRDVGRVTGKAEHGAALAATIPGVCDKTIEELLTGDCEEGASLRARLAERPELSEVLNAAAPLSGIKAEPGKHACGVVVSDDPLDDLVPMRIDAKSGAHVTTWEAPELEGMGFLKIDRLGLKNLDVIAGTLDLIERDLGEHLDAEYGSLPMDGRTDERAARTYRMLQAGNTAGVFQLEGDGMTKLLVDIKPENLNDLTAAVALYRPGPMGAGMHTRYVNRKHGREPATYDYLTSDPREAQAIGRVLDKSYGVIVVQEDLMSLSQVVAGFGPGLRNRLRKAFSKKNRAEMDALRQVFLERGPVDTVDDPDADMVASIAFAPATVAELWRTFDASAEYLFNACLTGETTLWAGRGVGERAEKWTVEGLYHRLYGDDGVPAGTCPHCGQRPSRARSLMCSRCASWLTKFRDKRGFTLLALSSADGRIRPARVKDVHCHGVKPVSRVTLADGTVLRATSNHRFLTGLGYRRVDELKPGDTLVADGGYEAQRHKLADRVTVGARRQQGTVNGAFGEQNYGYVDGGFTRLMSWTKDTRDDACCDECGRTAGQGRLERAHLDGNRANNARDNLAWKCPRHHKLHDYASNCRPRRWEKGRLTRQVAVVSITPDGEELVYDVEMADGTDHNFLADGVVSHNSHTAPYAYLGYVTAFLKANWPAQFGVAQLSVTDDDDQRLAMLYSLRGSGLDVRPPDVNTSSVHPTADGQDRVQLGLYAIDGVKDNAELIVAERERGGPFTSLADLAGRVHATGPDGKTKQMPVNVLEALIEAGACDQFGPRQGQMAVVRSLRDRPDLSVPDIEWEIVERSMRQRSRLGLSWDNPLQVYARQLQSWSPGLRVRSFVEPVHALTPTPGGAYAMKTGAGVLSRWDLSVRGGKERVEFTVEGTHGVLPGVMWQREVSALRAKGFPRVGDVVAVQGRVKLARNVHADDDGGGDDSRLEIVASDMAVFPVPDGGGRTLDRVVVPLRRAGDGATAPDPQPSVPDQVTVEGGLVHADDAPRVPMGGYYERVRFLQRLGLTTAMARATANQVKERAGRGEAEVTVTLGRSVPWGDRLISTLVFDRSAVESRSVLATRSGDLAG